MLTNFKNDTGLFTECKIVFDDYSDENVMELVDDKSEVNAYYLPYRAVILDDKFSTNIQIVFDASDHAMGELSLNNCLYTDDNLIPDLFSLYIKFRNFFAEMTADIHEALPQIELTKNDNDFTRFFLDEERWNEESNRNIKIYIFQVRLFFKLFQVLNKSLYINDFISSKLAVDSAIQRSTESYKMFQEAKYGSQKMENKIHRIT